jgi:uncharacterized protein YecT (DUF1311 family)
LILPEKDVLSMQRNMQNISFFVIIAILLGCNFVFSQCTNPDASENAAEETSIADDETIADIPDCSDIKSEDDLIPCYQDAVAISNRLVDSAVDDIIALEADSDERLTFLDVQMTWEESRDAECSFVFDRETDPQKAKADQLKCLLEENLDRVNQLQIYLCDWYADDLCPEDGLTDE